jgi:hypothetical protein
MRALVIVHLSSLDADARQAGMEEAYALADRLKNAILAWNGPVYVIDQRWPIDKWAKPRWELVMDVQLRREIRWEHFDDRYDWDIFMTHFAKDLVKAGIRNVTLGGIWYYPGEDGGSVNDLRRVLFKKHFHIVVDKDLTGSWVEAA